MTQRTFNLKKKCNMYILQIIEAHFLVEVENNKHLEVKKILGFLYLKLILLKVEKQLVI